MDKRKKSYKKYKEIKEILLSKECLCAVILGSIIGLSLGTHYWKSCQPKLLTPLVKPEAVKVVQEVEASEPKEDCESKMGYIRCASRSAGLSDKDGSTLIRIARAESGCNIDPTAKNSLSTARGSFQILIGTWEGNDCDGKRTDHKSNTDCAIKIYKLRGTQPWETSEHQKSGNGWGDPNQCIRSLK